MPSGTLQPSGLQLVPVTQAPSQRTWPEGQAHRPPVQTCPSGQAGSQQVPSATQVPPQSSWPAGQPQKPLAQARGAAHGVPQAPQLAALLARSAQVPLQSSWPAGHSQVPFTQFLPPVQAGLQPVAQVPVATQVPLQSS